MGKGLKYLGTGCSSIDKVDSFETDPDCCFWESQLYYKSYFREKNFNNGYPYYDNYNCLKFLFFHWLNKWISLLSRQYVEPYKLHPLPIADQILYWQPIFSKHVSDGLIKLEANESLKASSSKVDNASYQYKSILIRAALLTFWKRTLFALLGIVLTNLMSMSISFLVKRLLKILKNECFGFVEILFLLLSIILLQVVDELLIENFTFYIYRLICMVQCILSVTLFQHGFCYRRKFFNNVEGTNSLGVCNEVVHSYSPDSECSKNPLYCPALRYQNKPIAPNLFAIDFTDTFYVSVFLESLVSIVQFLSNFIYGILLISFQVKVNLWVLYVVGLCFVLMVVFIEIFNTYIFKLIFLFRDFRISKCLNILPSLPIIYKMLLDDIALNAIVDVRNNELLFFAIRQFFSFFNMTMYTVCINVSFYLIKSYFVKAIDDASIVTDIDTAAFMTTFYIFLRIINSMFLIPVSIKIMTLSILSFIRVNKFAFNCSPNFYISDNKFIGSNKMTSEISVVTNKINKDTVVLYRDASFAWINSRKDLLNKNYNPYLKNINFELKRGEIVIVTGAQGSGKSNFIKSILGEMTLVGGSMAVVPLHTSMPIFYASQDIWLKKGTVRSNITFGYKFDEVLYNKVLKAVELEFDISTWEGGDMRTVSDYAHTLSGGQRLRVELARALYAYLVFSHVNKEYNNSQCSFLMCLDSPFLSLDPFVSKIVFNNLFNIKSGLLVNDDLSVLITSDFQSLDKFVISSNSCVFNPIKIYVISNGYFSFYCNYSDFAKFKRSDLIQDPRHISTVARGPYFINYFSADLFKLCSSGSQTRNGRKTVTRIKYTDSRRSYIIDDLNRDDFNPYITYIKAAGISLFIFVLLTLILTVFDDVKFIFATNLSDYLANNIDLYNNGEVISMTEIRFKSHFYRKISFIFLIIIIILSVFSTVFMTFASVAASRKFHEYCIYSIFKNSSEVLKIKEQISQMITFVTCDTIIIDRDIALCFNSVVIKFIHTLIHMITLFYLVPISIPFFLFTLVFIYRFVLIRYVISTRNIQFGYLEATSQINNVFENAISGSTIYRSYKKEWEFLRNVIEHDDYKLRSRFMALALRVWASVLFNWIFSISTFIVLIVLILFDRYTRFKLKIGYFGLGLSLSMNVVKSFTTFSMTFTRLAKFMCNIYRFRSFIPEGTKYKFIKRIDTNDETFVIKNNPDYDYKIDTSELMDRRMVEFKNENKNFLRLNKLFYKPKINVVDIRQFITRQHSGVDLIDVYVYTSLEHKPDGIILRSVNASAHRSEIIGIIGRTGAGKTTLLSVLENTVRNRTGQVLLDGKDLNDIPKNVVRQIIGVLPQLPFVFRGWTVRRFLDPRRLFSDNDINEALDKCGLLDFVNNLEGGKKLDSIILPDDVDVENTKSRDMSDAPKFFHKTLTIEMNDNPDANFLLSNTQLRTLSFARLVLYRYFYRLIIIDEPPDKCDEDDQKSNFLNQDIGIPMYELIKRYFKHCTTFVTAHDVNVIRMSTYIWVVHEGQLIRACKGEKIKLDETISDIIEQMVKKYSKQK